MLADAHVDRPSLLANNISMGMQFDVDASELHDAAIAAAQGTRDRAAAKSACERMDRQREELLRKLGELRVSGEVIREVRQP
jgi:hypothetical protein